MNEWASSPWATDDTSTAPIPHLSPAPPSFAKTSPSLDSGYFNAFTNEAVWGDGGTTIGSSSLDDGGISGGFGSGAWGGLKSPRPIASPGRIANGKGNRWVRPTVVGQGQEANNLDKSTDNDLDAREAGVADSEAWVEYVSDLNGPKAVDEEGGMEDNHLTPSEETNQSSESKTDHGLGIVIVEDLKIQGTTVELEGYGGSEDELNAPHPDAAMLPEESNSVSETHIDAREISDGAQSGMSVRAEEAAQSISDRPRRHSETVPERRQISSPPAIEFPVDLTIVAKVFPSTASDLQTDLPLLDTIITTSSARKIHYRITRPYSLRQYNSGNFENSSRASWRDSAIHEKTVNYVADWIAKDRACGGGVFDVPSAKRRSGFGWGSDEKTSTPTVSASSIMLPKIVGPSAFGWSSAAMTPLQPSKAGEEQVIAPKASTEVAEMRPRPRRTPIRNQRAVSNKVSVSSPVATSDSLDLFNELGVLETPTISVEDRTDAPAGLGPEQATDNVVASEVDMADDFGIFEEATDDFQDFAIAPPPSRPTTVPPLEGINNFIGVGMGPDAVGSFSSSEPTLSHTDDIATTNDKDHESGLDAAFARPQPANREDLVLRDLPVPSDSTAPPYSSRKSLEKETLFDNQEDEFDDFEPFESASPIEVTYTGPSPDGLSKSSLPPADFRNEIEVKAEIEPELEPEFDYSKAKDSTVPSSPLGLLIQPMDHAPFEQPDVLGSASNATAAPVNDMMFDDSSIFESSTVPLSAPSLSNTVLTNDTITESTSCMPIPPWLPSAILAPLPSLPRGDVPQAPDTTIADSAEDDDDDDFGAFEEATVSANPPESSMVVSDFQKQSHTPSSTIDAPHMLTSDLVSARSANGSITTLQQTQPPPMLASVRPSTPVPPTLKTTTTASTADTSTRSSASSMATTRSTKQPSRPAKSAKPNAKPIDTGASILNILAFLDAADNDDGANEDEDDRTLYDQHPSEFEALAGEKIIKRLRREEWVGEKPVIGSQVNGVRDANRNNHPATVGRGQGGADEVDEKVVQEVVKGLPDWEFMLK